MKLEEFQEYESFARPEKAIQLSARWSHCVAFLATRTHLREKKQCTKTHWNQAGTMKNWNTLRQTWTWRMISVYRSSERFSLGEKRKLRAARGSGITATNLNKKRQRRRKITWFNPPFSCNIATNIGREFLRIFSKNFPLKHRYHKIFNRNTVKILYSCLPSMSSIIKSHNNKVIANSQKTIDGAKSDGKKKPVTAGNKLHAR